jgi:hypothetical protein
LKLICSFSFWPQQVSNHYQKNDQPNRKKNLQTNGEIASRTVDISKFFSEIGLKEVKHSFSNGHAKISQTNELHR